MKIAPLKIGVGGGVGGGGWNNFPVTFIYVNTTLKRTGR